jgi:NADH:ubiquinone oxidoreductase subunit H
MESELVSGFMTEHAAVVFVFFFLAEYASIVLICVLTTILFLGGYLYCDLAFPILNIIQYISFGYYLEYLANKEV